MSNGFNLNAAALVQIQTIFAAIRSGHFTADLLQDYLSDARSAMSKGLRQLFVIEGISFDEGDLPDQITNEQIIAAIHKAVELLGKEDMANA